MEDLRVNRVDLPVSLARQHQKPVSFSVYSDGSNARIRFLWCHRKSEGIASKYPLYIEKICFGIHFLLRVTPAFFS